MGVCHTRRRMSPTPPTLVVTDSACDLPQTWLDAHGVKMVPLSVNFETQSYTDRVDIDNAAFFDLLAKASDPPKTSQPPPAAFMEVFSEAAAEGKDVLCLTMSARMSGTHSSAVTAAEISKGDVMVVDSEAMSVLLAAQVVAAAGVLERGGSRQEAAAEAARVRASQELLFTVPDLLALRAGGRIGRAAALLGGVLQVRPILTMQAGEVEVQSRVRTNSGARKAIIERLAQRVRDEGKKAQVMVASANDPAMVDDLAAKVRAYASNITRLEVGPVIAAHTGAGTGGIGYHFD
jgi:DegV family protein with EDD domain